MWLRKNALKLAIGVALVVMIIATVMTWWYSNQRTLVALAKNVYWEALVAKEPELSSRMVARVTTERAKANKSYWGGKDIHDVVYARKTKKNGIIVCQFHWTCQHPKNDLPPEFSKKDLKLATLEKKRWELALQIAREELSGKFTPPEHVADATSYLNPTYSGQHNVCEFKTTKVLLGKAELESQHVFYRDPRDAIEKALLPKRAEVDECKTPPKKKKISKGPG